VKVKTGRVHWADIDPANVLLMDLVKHVRQIQSVCEAYAKRLIYIDHVGGFL
jgi:hypothetical protein